MNAAGLILFVAAAALLVLAIRGLFNRRRSLLCALAGLLVALGAIPGGLHAWGEARSLFWTAGYAALLVAGGVAALRQFRLPPRE